MPTQQIASFGGDVVVFEFDYDGDPPRLRRFRTRNNGDTEAKLTAYHEGSNVLVAQYEAPANTTIEVIINGGRQLRVNDDGDYEIPYTVMCSV